MTRIQIVSDLHLEFHADGGATFLRSLPVAAPVLIVAGDLCTAPLIPAALDTLCARFPSVVYVHGNHEFYHAERSHVIDVTAAAAARNGNLHALDCSAVTLGEGAGALRIHGAPLWFRAGGSREDREGMSDFLVIPQFTQWVYAENERAREYLAREVSPGDVVVTHHLPHSRSVAARFSRSRLNQFFLCDMTDVIERAKPALWVHGHTHDRCDYRVDGTRVVCNPAGYSGYEQTGFRPDYVVEIP